MNRMTFTRLAMAGAALLLLAATQAPSQASPVGPAATQASTAPAGAGLTEVGYRHHGYFRHHHRHHGGVRFFFAPVIVHDGYYGYDRYREEPRGLSCYRACRDFHGPDYCRINYRRYC